MAEKILIIEDEQAIQALLKNFLETASYEVDLASDGVEGIAKFQSGNYDLILLDVMLPKIDGYSVLELIRKDSKIPVMMITAMGHEQNQVKAFDLQVDDYVVKPFILSLILKRVEALLRRSGKTERVNDNSGHVLKYKDLVMDTGACEVFVAGQPLALTNKEYELLKVFLENPNQVFERDLLLQKIWGDELGYGNPKCVNVHIRNLRRKLAGDYIETIRGVGYKIGKEI